MGGAEPGGQQQGLEEIRAVCTAVMALTVSHGSRGAKLHCILFCLYVIEQV